MFPYVNLNVCMTVPACVCIVCVYAHTITLYCVFSDSSSAAERRLTAWHNVGFFVVMTPCTWTEKMERNVQRSIFLTTQLKGLCVVLSFMAHLDNTAAGQKSIGLILRSAAMDTGDYVCLCVYGETFF